MKRITSLLLLLSLALGITISCTTDASTDFNEPENNATLAYRNSLWNGVIGVDKGLGEYIITADRELVFDDLEAILTSQNKYTDLKFLNIVLKKATNDPIHDAYMLVGSDSEGTSIGVWLKLDQRQFTLENVAESIATTCTGCASGCNLQYLNIEGKKVAYCNENGCIYDCTKSETSFAAYDGGL